ncbi:MAG: dTDP-4-dehydrorhamnose 3,5-epimerase family protein [Thermoanaerobaculia bacterium]|nr:dTDP-4-dehydrorhamnose 3,5-epimerase family protein [Thermoanaerobaculia bacterium]
MEGPVLIPGGLAADDRGHLAFVNGFDFAGVRRFYLVENHRRGFVRAWHAHRHEAKHVLAVSGSALVCAVEIDDWDRPSKSLPVSRFVLSSRSPAVLSIPAGYANGFMSLTDGARLLFFSTASLEQSRGDDVRYDARYWNPWEVVER